MTVSAGINEIRKDQTILLIDQAMLKGEFRENPKSFPSNIKIFGGMKPFYGCLMFTKNSPLLPMFRRAATQLTESGQYDRIDVKWKGSKIPEEAAAETMILTAGQTYLVFAFYLFFLGTTLILISIECCHNFYKKYTGLALAPPEQPALLPRQNFLRGIRQKKIFSRNFKKIWHRNFKNSNGRQMKFNRGGVTITNQF